MQDKARRGGISQTKWLMILEPQYYSLNVRQTWTFEVTPPLKYTNTMQQTQTQTLVRELRSHMPNGIAQKRKKW